MYKISKFDIILFSSLAIIIGVVYFIFFFTNKNKEVEKEFNDVNDYGLYFMVINNINDLLSDVSNNETNKVYNLIDKKYINDYGISANSSFKFINNYGDDIFVKVDNMLFSNIDDNFIFYVHGVLRKEGYSDEIRVVDNDYNIMMFLDTKNMSYSFYPLSDNNYKSVVDDINSISVSKNNDNKYNGTSNINNDVICSLYFSDFIYKIDNDIDLSYKVIGGNTKDELFKNKDSYINFIKNNRDKFGNAAVKCAVDGVGSNVYHVYDDKNNYYEFVESKILKYYVDFKMAS